jgi:hypothetical protein
VELDLGRHPDWFGRRLQVWLRGDQGDWRRADTEPGWKPRGGGGGVPPASQVLLLAPVPAGALRVQQAGPERAPWAVSELRIDALPSPAAPARD